jgi:hypothetical protein
MDALIKIEVSNAIDSFKIDEAALKLALSEPIARDLSRRAIAVESAAKRNATGRPGPNVRTGRLRGSITWRLGGVSVGIYADIGSSVFYAPFVELGTSRSRAYPYLVPALEAARD